ncbi:MULTISPECIES: tetratricopeptide repeat protein [Comamonas]|uniref:tetratricopeptide repeat protein n=1 Tax=Comamonas TaxID=283 RepID=UPI00103A08ED|nr:MULTISPECIES: hypothetical protein [Comamonas]TZG09489.1 hypothetical protein FZC30_12635 [Comamonas thiooxydans]UNV92922.1 hypothetical protein MP576_11525 [Comamonas sp. 7D-2evo1]UNV93776.1 hypothetical protein MPZ60_14825 [Comamonas sp. 7D-2]UNW02561.1 hypothetical protein MP579_11515 [Comamonas sp. 7D-2evo2]
MRVAVCVSGQVRDFSGSLLKSIENLCLPVNPDFYFSVWENKGQTSALDRIVPSVYHHYFFDAPHKNHQINLADFQQKFPKFFSKINECGTASECDFEGIESKVFDIEPDKEDYISEPSLFGVTYPLALLKSNPRDIFCLPMFYKIWKCNELLDGEYDYVLRVRADFDLKEKIDVIGEYKKVGDDGLIVRSTPLETHVDDQFAFGTQEVMRKYSNIWPSLSDYWGDGVRLTSGFLLYHHLVKEGVRVHKIQMPSIIPYSKYSLDDLVNIFEECISDNHHVFSSIRNEISSEIKMKKIRANGISAINFDSCEPLQIVAYGHERKGSIGAALDYYYLAVKKDPLSAFSYAGAGRCASRLGKFSEAVRNYLSAYLYRPKDWVILRELSRNLMYLDRKDDAKFYIEKAMKVAPNQDSVKELFHVLLK